MLEGTYELLVDGQSHVLSAGDVLVIPGDTVHSGGAHTDCRILDVFSPVREEYR
jgi:unsaturated pyranuronate lyase